MRAFVGLGSNLARPRLQIRQALHALDRLPCTRVVARSPVYRNPAVGMGPSPAFLNAVAELDTRLEPRRLLAALHDIEKHQGRRRRAPGWQPRPLDLDLLLHGDRVMHHPGLRLPHPAIAKRNFVLYPLADVAPGLCLPDGRRVAQLAQQLTTRGLTRIYY